MINLDYYLAIRTLGITLVLALVIVVSQAALS